MGWRQLERWWADAEGWEAEEEEEEEADKEVDREDDADTEEAIWFGVTLGTTVQKILCEEGGGRET